MTLLTLYAPRLKLVILETSGLYEWLVLPSHAPDIARHLAYARDLEYTKSEAVKIGRLELEYFSEQLSAITEGAIFRHGRQGEAGKHP